MFISNSGVDYRISVIVQDLQVVIKQCGTHCILRDGEYQETLQLDYLKKLDPTGTEFRKAGGNITIQVQTMPGILITTTN